MLVLQALRDASRTEAPGVRSASFNTSRMSMPWNSAAVDSLDGNSQVQSTGLVLSLLFESMPLASPYLEPSTLWLLLTKVFLDCCCS